MSEESELRRAVLLFGRLLDFEGRTRRADYWPYILVLAAIYFVGFFLAVLAIPGGLRLSIGPAYALTGVLSLLALSATVRRLHDVGWSGLWAVAYVVTTLGFISVYFFWRYGTPSTSIGIPPPPVPMVVLMPLGFAMNLLGLMLFVLCLLDGTAGPNRHGPDPKGRSAP